MSWLTFLVLLPLVQEVPTAPPADLSAPVTVAAAPEDVADAAPAPEEPPSPRVVVGGGEVTLATSYVDRGEPQYPTMTTPSIQPAVYVDFDQMMPGALRVDVWSAFALVNRERASEQGNASEMQFSVFYEGAVARDYLELGGGFIYYIYPGEDEVDGEKELVFTIGTGNLPLSISSAFYFEAHPGLGLHIEPRIGWEQEHGDFTIGMDTFVGATIDREAGNSLDHATLTAHVGQTVGRISFGLSLSYTLRIAPAGLSFFERSLLYGALVFGVT